MPHTPAYSGANLALSPAPCPGSQAGSRTGPRPCLQVTGLGGQSWRLGSCLGLARCSSELTHLFNRPYCPPPPHPWAEGRVCNVWLEGGGSKVVAAAGRPLRLGYF